MSNPNRVSSHFRLQDPRFDGPVMPLIPQPTTNYATAGAVTYTTDDLLSGLIHRDTNGAARTDTLPTAALLVAAIQGAMVGTSFEVNIKNTASAANTLTVAAGAGGTTSGTMTVAQLNVKCFVIILTNVTIGSEAYTIESLGTSVF